jgi:hypothetical protein
MESGVAPARLIVRAPISERVNQPRQRKERLIVRAPISERVNQPRKVKNSER